MQSEFEPARPAFKSNPDATMIVDCESGRIVAVNSSFERMFGFQRDEVIGRTTLELGIYQDSADRERLLDIMRNGGVIFDAAIRCRTRTGAPVSVLFSGEVIELMGWRHFLSAWEDMAVREMFENSRDNLRQTQKMEALGTLAGGIAHDFNNVLTPIMLNLEMAELEAADTEAVRGRLAEVRKASKRAAALVQRILTFSRKQKSDRKLIRLEPVIADAIRMIQSSLPATIHIDARVDPLAPKVLSDANQIQQIVTNLCANAAHAMRNSQGRLKIRLESVELKQADLQDIPDLHPGLHVRLSVSDTGHGMDAETLKRIFEPFFTTKAPGEGTGLGLAIVYGIVKDHEGAITVHSQQGIGTTFAVYFPGRISDTQPTTTAVAASPVRGGGVRLLYVDDEPSICAAVSGYLGHIGYHVTTFSDSHEALKIFRTAPDSFDVVITDLTMPGLTGIELARKILFLRPKLPVMMVSGSLGVDLAETARVAGIRRILPKPLEPSLLVQAINQLKQEAEPTGDPDRETTGETAADQ
jgi:PAS domain S-box-containing protein